MFNSPAEPSIELPETNSNGILKDVYLKQLDESNKDVNRKRALFALALLVATYLSVTLVHLGIDKFYYTLAGGKKFATFADLHSQLGIGLSYLFLSILYLVWIGKHFQHPSHPSSWRFRDLLKPAIPFLALAFIAYPLGNDIYIYLHAGLMNLSHANPFLIRAAAFTTELSPYVDWGQTSAYGPVSQLIFTLSAAFVLAHPIVAVYIFKAICVALHTLNGYLIWRYLPVVERSKVTIAYLLHPLLLMEQVSSGHIDILVSTSLIGFALCFAKQRYWGGFTLLWGGFLAKTLPIIWAPLIAIAFLRRGLWKLLLGMIGVSAAILAVLSLTVLPGIDAWRSLLNPGVEGQFQSSFLAIARFAFDVTRILIAPAWLTLENQREMLATIARIPVLGFLGFYAWRLWRSDTSWNNTPEMLLEEMGWITLVLLLFATSWLMPWYCSVLLTFAALIPRARLFGATSLAFALSSSAQYVLVNNSSIKSLVSVGLPIVVFLVGAWLLRRNTSSPEPAETAASSTQAFPAKKSSI